MAAPNTKQVIFDFPRNFRIFSDGAIERLRPHGFVPASDDPTAAVRSKDVVIDPDTGVSVRIYAPRLRHPPHELPLVFYIHGGAFCIDSAATPIFHKFISTVVERADVVAVSVEYRLAPENPMPIPYEDCWTAFKWTAAHAGGTGPEPWLNELADFGRVFLGGESAGANIANDVAIRSGVMAESLPGVEIEGLFLMHPYFSFKGEDTLYKILFPGNIGGEDDPRLNPAVDPRIGSMGGRRVLFCVAEKDFLKERACAYSEELGKSAWGGEVEMMETEGEGHCFYLHNVKSEKAVAVMDRLVTFLKN